MELFVYWHVLVPASSLEYLVIYSPFETRIIIDTQIFEVIS